ncbi:hypothetical protein KKR91_14805 [Arthrobacter jiangjiafuii]|uniref:Tight adherence protein B n=2 Tax=Arthrobacter jiangjiafuii TaxID=2817475 RepID=A0A975M8D1_9MICC|nr:hypothetical protein [Arthrobacter jiangjiafuii]QWC11858.1 hypothetical protein KKR91_14805 [Arthrobacter jiangjiafuii]
MLLARFLPSRRSAVVQEIPLVIHQLTGLLAAGRAPHQLWADAAVLQLASLQSASSDEDPGGTLAGQLLPVLEAAAQAASLGLSPVPVFLAAAGKTRRGPGSRSPKLKDRPGRSRARGTEIPGGLWVELAACVRVSERSGAPLAGVLDRYAGQLESSLDQQAARDTALAGPQATVRLLTWLPVGGFGLGYLLGADPVGVLLGSPMGWFAAAAGIALSVIGRLWSAALVRQAAGS